MQQHRLSASRDPQTLRRVVASALLLLYLATATPLAPGLTALLAATDTSHHVAIEQTAQGVRVVLRHECLNSAMHRHGWAARVLVVFAQRTTPAQPDHVITFAATDTARETSTLNAEPESRSMLLDDLRVIAARPGFWPLHRFSAAFPRPPPVVSELMLAVRSTVLLV